MILELALKAYGYPILFLGTILEGETFVIISAILCQIGHLKVTWVVCTAFFGALSGDLFFFLMGRFSGGTFLKKGSRWQRRADKGSRLLERHQGLIVFSYRFFYGLRAVIPFLIDVTDYNFRRFILLSSAGALVWSITVTAAGVACGKVLLLFITDIKNYQLFFISALGVIGLILGGVYHFKHRKTPL